MRNFDYMKLADRMWDGEVLSYVIAGSGYSGNAYLNNSGGQISGLSIWKNSPTQYAYRLEYNKYIDQYESVIVNDDFFVKS